MNQNQALSRAQSAREEIANSLSHGIGLIAAVLAVPVLMFATIRQGNAASIVGASIFATTMVLLYLTSTLYHALPDGRARECLLKLDHGAIYLFIAGSYTPFALCTIHGVGGWLLFCLVWLLAIGGMLLKAFDRIRHPVLSTGLYVVMGWVVLMAAYPLVASMTTSGIEWLVLGGIAYTVGVVFFAADSRIRYSHCVWHVFVMAGTSCHFVAVMGSALP
ncbi:MAG: channel protein hemolysin family [Rhodocyclales bacterium]|nr:channel protein hemolysin family [Rhodocyclales bacterium]